MNTEQIKHVIEASKIQSFTKAAENLYLKPSSLRESIIRLEDEIGCTLFIRTKRGVLLTEEGKNILPQFYKIMEIYDKICYLKGDMHYSTILNIGVSHYYMGAFFNSIYTNFTELFPDIKFQTTFLQSSSKLLENVYNNKLDVALVTHFSNFEKENLFSDDCYLENLNIETFKYEPLFMVTSLKHPLANLNNYDNKEFSKYPIISYFEDISYLKLFLGASFDNSNVIISAHSSINKDLILSQDAIYFFPSSKIETIFYGDLNTIENKFFLKRLLSSFDLHLSIVTHKKFKSKTVQDFIKIFKNMCYSQEI